MATDSTCLNIIAKAVSSPEELDGCGIKCSFEKLGIIDSDFTGLTEQEAIIHLDSLIKEGNTAAFYITDADFPEFCAIFPHANGAEVNITKAFGGFEVLFFKYKTTDGLEATQSYTDWDNEYYSKSSFNILKPLNTPSAKITSEVIVPQDTETDLVTLEEWLPAGKYRLIISGIFAYDTTRDVAEFRFDSTSHTIVNSCIEIESKDPNRNTDFTYIDDFEVPAGGQMVDFTIRAYHNKAQQLIVKKARIEFSLIDNL
jgi:hypothetical protein